MMCSASSPIHEFYPDKFEIDMNGKRWKWQAVVLLPFIDEDCLLQALTSVENTLSDDERRRNRVGEVCVYVNSIHPLAQHIIQLRPRTPTKSESNIHVSLFVEFIQSDGLTGSLSRISSPSYSEKSFEYPSPFHKLRPVSQCEVVGAFYAVPEFLNNTKLLDEVILPPRVLPDASSSSFRSESFGAADHSMGMNSFANSGTQSWQMSGSGHQPHTQPTHGSFSRAFEQLASQGRNDPTGTDEVVTNPFAALRNRSKAKKKRKRN